MKDYKFAAIDVGSNAVRLLLSRVIENGAAPVFKKEALVRVPIRLGDDVFKGEQISDHKRENLIKTMKAFKYLMEAYESLDYAACATSAVRDAANGGEVLDAIREQSGVDVNMVDGQREAEIIFEHHLSGSPFDDHSALYIDVGGGSTDITVFNGRDAVRSASFNIGTIRLLENLVADRKWKELKKWLKSTAAELHPTLAVGTGGNINKVFRLSRQKDGKPITYGKIKDIRKYLASYTMEERIKKLMLRPDRADVIVPAADIFIAVMKWSGIKDMYVPQVGLSDGLIRILYHSYKEAHADA